MVNIPVAGDENPPKLTSDFYTADIVISDGGAYSLDPELSLVAQDPDPFPVNKEFSFELIGQQQLINLFKLNRYMYLEEIMNIQIYSGDFSNFFTITRNPDQVSAVVTISGDFNFDALPAETGQISMFVEV